MIMHPDAHPGRKILAQAAAERAVRELLDGETLKNFDGPILTMRNPSQPNFRWMHSPEVDLLDYDCDIPAPELRKLAKARFEARMVRKAAGRARYQRRHGQWCRNVYKDPWPAWYERRLHTPR
jgi:hypothetical protein